MPPPAFSGSGGLFDGSEGGGEGKHAGNGCIDPNEVDRRSFDRKWPGATRAAWSRRPHEVEKSRRSRPPQIPSLTFCLARAQVLLLYAALSLAEDCHAQERVRRA